ncbi:hypothetical protein NQ315_014974 [Exocentrus adspersus]|uniref:Alpha-taxilin n=1 Tax=Exocentrus adspersus TaxID=1586481 RepID=A0AAV8VWR6_9CUCU|nr:hypothetical protein NQ315_014974 [Exocentrus adspersus]
MSDHSDDNRCPPPSASSSSSSTSTSTSAARRKEEKARKKDPKALENVMKSMGDISEPEKLKNLMLRYEDLYSEYRRVSSSFQAMEKSFNAVCKERDVARFDLNKNILAKSKLESVCRELQKQNKAIKDENITRVKEEEEKRREVATNFTERLNSLSSMMDENKDKSIRLREENMNMTLKLTELYNKFQERENHLADVNRQLETQKELFESKIKKLELEHKADRKAWEEESKALLANLLKSNETNRLLEENIKSMQANLDVYKNQYSDFEQTMSRSNEVFKTFHGEINKLQKSNIALEREKNEYVAKWQSCHKLIVEISEKNQELGKNLDLYKKKFSTLEKLCRQLQMERATLHKQLQDKNGQQQDDNQLVNFIPVLQEPLINTDTPKELLNGEIKSLEDDSWRSDEYAAAQEAVNLPSVSGVAGGFPDVLPPMPLPLGEPPEAPILEIRCMDDDAINVDPSDGASFASTDDLENTMISVDPSIGSEFFIKEARSQPVTKGEHAQIFPDAQTVPGSSTELRKDSSEVLALYKPQAVTDVPTQGGHTTFVRESEARTNIREAGTGDEGPSGSLGPAESTGAIEVRESIGTTEIKKAKKK